MAGQMTDISEKLAEPTAPKCKCVPGQYQCGPCEAEDYRRAGQRMSQKDHAYDRWVQSSQHGDDE